MLQAVSSSQLTEMIAYYYIDTGQYKKKVDQDPKVMKKRMRAQFGDRIKKADG